MLCRLCETCVADIVHRDIATWRRVSDEQCYAFKHGTYSTITASAAAGCQLCLLFDLVRRQRIQGYDGLAEKWHQQHATVSVQQARRPYVFELMTEAPVKSRIEFEFFKPAFAATDREDNIDTEFVLPRDVSSSPPSGSVAQIVQRWIDSCRHEHTCCGSRDDVLLPTRVIDVGVLDDASPVCLRVNAGHCERGQYVTLSHCWGTGPRLTTTTHNLAEFEHEIPRPQLSQTFQDAISLTRLLGVRYLWIDALCIAQDDQDDWRRESAAMCAVYENAAFSISAVSAANSDSGLFCRQHDGSCIVSVEDYAVGIRPQLDTMDVALQHSKIESRAWCMQERILAPAILHVGPQQWYWECRAGTFSESYPAGCESISDGQKRPVAVKYHHIPSDASRVQLLDIWYSLVHQYSARALTKPTDRLPAIAGLADKLAHELGSPSAYSHGLWIDDFLTGLLWQQPIHSFRKLLSSRDHYSAQQDPSQRPAAGRFRQAVAPSWSWAAIRGAVSYEWRERFPFARTSDQLDLVIASRSNDHNADESDAHSERNEQSFPIHITGYLRRGTCRLRATPQYIDKADNDAGSVVSGNATFKPSGSLIADDGVACILDDVEEVVPKSCYCLRVSSWCRDQAKRSGRKAKGSTKTFYLVLERLQTSMDESPSPSSRSVNFLGKFRRIGMGYDDPEKVNRVFMNAERHAIDIA